MAVVAAGLLLAVGACTADPGAEADGTAVDTAALPDQSLRELAGDRLAVGVAVSGGGHRGKRAQEPITADPLYRALVGQQFSSLTPENQLKWTYLRPDEQTFDFDGADAVVDFAEEHGQRVRGHTLMWHSNVPAWLEGGDHSADQIRDLLHEHVTTVVGRYAGRIEQWDVVNEVFDDAGNLRSAENLWIRELGPEVIADMFRWAHEADPDAVLFVNDYNVESAGPKSDAYYDLVRDLLAEGVPVGGFGVQGHLSVEYRFPTDVAENLQRFADLGLTVAITEADVRVPVGADGPSDADLALQAEYYERLLEACLDVEACTSFTVWGLGDAYSWVPSVFDGEGAALLFDEELAPKPAFDALVEVLEAN